MSDTQSDKALLRRLLAEPRETEWLEWKHNNANPQDIGEYMSALANSSALAKASHGYLVWGVDDKSHQLVGTSFRPEEVRVQQQDLAHWLATQLRPRTSFSFRSLDDDGKHFVILEISPATESPVAFKGMEFIRIGSHKKRLVEHVDYERRLWQVFDRHPFEDGLALDQLGVDGIVTLLDYPAYFNQSRTPLPENRSQIIEALQAAGMIGYDVATGWAITNLGATLFGKRFDRFPSLSRKALRVIKYRGTSRIETIREHVEERGYAAGFDGLIQYVMAQLEDSEVIESGIRRSINQIPELVLRELIANALIHQDFSLHGMGPMVEIFNDRVEITNPGRPLIPQERFVDSPARSRNERLARAARLMGISEERGSGWDKVAFAVEFAQLPAPMVEVSDNATRVVVFSSRRLDQLDKADRVRAVYLHACLRYVTRESVTNTSVRERFGLAPNRAQTASRFIRDAIDAGLLTPYDPTVGSKAMRYVPFWATSPSGG